MPINRGDSFETDVLIIGNGPSGIALSAFLSGTLPYYNTKNPHQNPAIHDHLEANQQISLLDQDLSWFSEIQEFNSSHFMSTLIDMLIHPNLGANQPSCLTWKLQEERKIPHIVVGNTSIGGSWNVYDQEMKILSVSNLMDLPGYTVQGWLNHKEQPKRLTASGVAAYLQSYAKEMKIQQNFWEDFQVSSLEKIGGTWIASNEFITIHAKFVVLACGKTSPKKLELPIRGHPDSRVEHDLKSFKKKVDQIRREFAQNKKEDPLPVSFFSPAPVIVIGSGVTSLDCVIYGLKSRLPVIHVVRKTLREIRSGPLSRVSQTHCPEYAAIFNIMIGHAANKNYTCYLSSNITSFTEEQVEVTTPSDVLKLNYTAMAICIGGVSKFQDILKTKHTFVDYQSEQDKSVFAIGAFSGDHFVRFAIGGCMRVAQHLNNNVCLKN